jgi:hypothetical protein
VRTVAQGNGVGRDAEVLRQRPLERHAARIGVADDLGHCPLQRRVHLRAGTGYVLVGTQLGQLPAEFRTQGGQIMAGIVGLQLAQHRIGQRRRIETHGTATG